MARYHCSLCLLSLLMYVSYSGNLYGTAGIDYIDGAGTLLQYNPSTGSASTVIKPSINLRDSDLGRGCFDGVNNIFYQVFNKFNTMNQTFTTGLYPYDLNIPTQQLPITYLPELYANQNAGAGLDCTSDPKSGDIYLWGAKGKIFPGTHQILYKLSYIDDKSILNMTIIKQYPIGINSDVSLVSGPMSVYDSKRDIIYFSGTCCDASNFSVYYYKINAMNGDIMDRINYDNNSWPLTTVAYHPMMDLFVGLKWNGDFVNNENNFVYYFRQIDPVDLSVVKQYNISNGVSNNDFCNWDWISSLNVENDIFYSIIFKEPESNQTCNGGLQYGYFVNVNITNGLIVGQSIFCEVGLNETCPFSIQYSSTQEK